LAWTRHQRRVEPKQSQAIMIGLRTASERVAAWPPVPRRKRRIRSRRDAPSLSFPKIRTPVRVLRGHHGDVELRLQMTHDRFLFGAQTFVISDKLTVSPLRGLSCRVFRGAFVVPRGNCTSFDSSQSDLPETGSNGLRAWHAVRVLSGPPRIPAIAEIFCKERERPRIGGVLVRPLGL
jgi:hypothetical protein